MKTIRQKLADTLGWGFILWLLGFAMGMLLFPFVPAARLGWFIMPVMAVVTVYVARKRFRYSGETAGYFVSVGVAWLVIAILFDYLFLVRSFAIENYYDADIFVYYALTLIIPVAAGMYFSRSSEGDRGNLTR